MTIAGCERELPICAVSDKLSIAGFIMFGDVEITEKVSAALLEKCPEHDIIVTAEAKGIPLGYEMARQGCREYVVARKGLKVYMPDPVSVEVESITTLGVQKLYIGRDEADKLRGRRVLVVDDVISTGESLKASKSWLRLRAETSSARQPYSPKATPPTATISSSSRSSRCSSRTDSLG